MSVENIHDEAAKTPIAKPRTWIGNVATKAMLVGGLLVGGVSAQSVIAPDAHAQTAQEVASRKKEGIDAISNLYLRKFDENLDIQNRFNKYRGMWSITVNDDVFNSGQQADRKNPTAVKSGKPSTAGTMILGAIGQITGIQAINEAAQRRADEARANGQIAVNSTANDAQAQAEQQRQVSYGIIDGVRQTAADMLNSDTRFTEERTNTANSYGLSPMDVVTAKRNAVEAYKELNDGRAPVEKVEAFDPAQIVREQRNPQKPVKRENDFASLVEGQFADVAKQVAVTKQAIPDGVNMSAVTIPNGKSGGRGRG